MMNEANSYTVLNAGADFSDALVLTDFDLGLVLGGNESAVTGSPPTGGNDVADVKEAASTVADFAALGAIAGSAWGPGGTALGAGMGAAFGAGMEAQEHFNIVDGAADLVGRFFDAVGEAQANPDRG